jgi:hypothetical protein
MSLGNRYLPSHPAGASHTYSFDYSTILPAGTIITAASLAILLNTSPPQASADFTVGEVEKRGRRVYCRLQGGRAATDYRLEWLATDSLGNTWPRTSLLLCAATG